MSTPANPIKLFHHPISGHVHRVELFLSLLGVPYELVHVELKKGEHKSEEFLKINPTGQLPAIDDNGTFVSDSNAILVYLAQKYDTDNKWIPADAEGAAAVQKWFSTAAGLLAFGAGAARLINLFNAGFNKEEVTTRANNLLKFMDGVLADNDYLLGGEITAADVAMYSYTARAPEGDIALDEYKNVTAWLERIEGLENFVPFVKSR